MDMVLNAAVILLKGAQEYKNDLPMSGPRISCVSVGYKASV